MYLLVIRPAAHLRRRQLRPRPVNSRSRDPDVNSRSTDPL